MRTITIHTAAPAKPAWGAPCNGCGVCCLAEPCPVGVLVSRRRSGACAALRWVEAERRYRCGVLQDGDALPVGGSGWVGRLWRRAALRLIASGQGCDCDMQLSDETEEGQASPGPTP